MNKEIITEKQGIFLIALFIVAEVFVLTRGMEAKQDFWLAIILGAIISIPFMLMFARLHKLFPKKDLFDINEQIFGKILGKVLSFLLIYYVATNMMSVMSVFNYFIVTVSLVDTPLAMTFLVLILLCIFGVKAGIEVMARWTQFFLPIIISVIVIGIVFLIPQMSIKNLFPILNQGVKPLLEGTAFTFLFPLSETIAFVMIFTSLKNNTPFKKTYMYGLLFGVGLILVLALTEVLVIGVNQTIIHYFPGYETFARLTIGTVVEGLEIISGTTFVLGGFIKLSILLLAVCRGLAKIFNFKDYRFVVAPTGFLIANISYIFYDSTMFMFDWIADIWGYFAFPFQVVMPIMIYIGAEIKMRLNKG